MLCTTPLTLALLTLVSTPFVLSRPTLLPRRDVGGGDVIDPILVANNALEAQTLNSEFGNMTISDPCTNGDVACIGGALAACAGGAWETQNCPSDLTCLAAPSLTDTGVIVSCTTQADVDSLINAAGGVTDSSCDDPTNVTSTADNNATCTETGSLGPIVTGGAGSNNGVVTVTVTLNPTDATTLPPVTNTIDPTQAASILSSLNANPSISISTISAPTAASTGAPVDGALAGAGAGTTILLTSQAATGAPSATTSAPAIGTGAVGVAGALAQGGDAQAAAPTTIILTPQPASASSTASQSSATQAVAADTASPPAAAAAAPGGYGY